MCERGFSVPACCIHSRPILVSRMYYECEERKIFMIQLDVYACVRDRVSECIKIKEVFLL